MSQKARSAVAAVVACALSSACGSAALSPPPVRDEQAVVAYVADGDTMRLAAGAKVRLVQIDAPELYTDCYGRAARRALLRLAPPGLRVILVRDPSLDDRDSYGRLLRYVLASGRNLNLALVAEGAAEPYFFHNERGAHAEELLRAAKRARSRRTGLWGACPGARLNPALGAVTGPA